MADPLNADVFGWEVGANLSDTLHGPITRKTLALFAAASNDHVALHIDSDFAKASGLEDVIAHGMLTMAYLAQALESWATWPMLRGWTVRFTAVVPVHSTIRCQGQISEVFHEGGERRARLKIGAWTQAGCEVVSGEAVVAIN